MPQHIFVLDEAGTRQVRVSQDASGKTTTVTLNGNVIGSIPNEELMTGWKCSLTDGSVLRVQLVNNQAYVFRDGQLLPTMSEGVVQITASFLRKAFLLNFCTPIIVIDGEPHRAGWRAPYFFTLMPGTHTIKIFFRYIWMAECGANSINVNVEARKVVTIEYYMPPWIFAAGSLKVMKVN